MGNRVDGARIDTKLLNFRFEMGKALKNHTVKPSKHRKRNKVQNLRKKKKVKSRNKEKSNTLAYRNLKQKVNIICEEFKKISTSQAIVKSKLKKDKRKLDRDMSLLCKDLKHLNTSTAPNDDDCEDKTCFPVIENLSKNVSELLISSDNYVPGFKFTRWQQRKLHKRVLERQIKYNLHEK